MTTLEQILTLRNNIGQSIIGQEEVVSKIIIALLTDGNVLLEGLPGLAKTRAVKALAANLSCRLSRIQFTPDLLPSDITGTEIYQPQSNDKFVFQPGPIFSNLVLADEINRAPAKVQAALLEAMEERQVSVAGKTYKMEPLFMVLATQNPIEQEGTYPLPEAQLDRFVMKIEITYPNPEEEGKIVGLVRNESKGSTEKIQPIDPKVIFDARKEINQVEVTDAAQRYMVDLITATRNPGSLGKNSAASNGTPGKSPAASNSSADNDLARWISYGASPRGTIALDRCSRVVAWLDGRNSVTPDDTRYVVHDVLRHRLILSYEANADRVGPNTVIDTLLKNVPVV